MRVFMAACIYVAATKHYRGIEVLFAVYLGSWGCGMLGKFIDHEVSTDVMYGNFGGVVWWQLPRLLHSIMLISFACATLIRYSKAYMFILADLVVAITSGLVYYSGANLLTVSGVLMSASDVIVSVLGAVAVKCMGPRLDRDQRVGDVMRFLCG